MTKRGAKAWCTGCGLEPKDCICCPICSKLYGSIDRAEYVCSDHESWLVTICDNCKRAVFSDCAYTCPACTDIPPRQATVRYRDKTIVIADPF